MVATHITPEELVARLLASPDYGTVAEIARAAGWNYQRLNRWSKGSGGQISQDDMADLLGALELRPEDFDIRPSLIWRRAHERAADQTEAPAWFTKEMERYFEALAELDRKLSDLLQRTP